ncbi:ribonuclease P protein component [Weissella confusa]|uniref:Ribonuclease P protein component n=1 Tax=Weissella confusa TaxID=1583 RepID=A0A923NI47_WEICO|nr:ribonuclease P protein component [Weissella confusa]
MQSAKKVFSTRSTEADFQLVFDQHHSVANKMFIVYTMEREQPTHFRLGISISKKVGLRGHERVWVKRRIRQSVLEFKPNFNGRKVLARRRQKGRKVLSA